MNITKNTKLNKNYSPLLLSICASFVIALIILLPTNKVYADTFSGSSFNNTYWVFNKYYSGHFADLTDETGNYFSLTCNTTSYVYSNGTYYYPQSSTYNRFVLNDTYSNYWKSYFWDDMNTNPPSSDTNYYFYQYSDSLSNNENIHKPIILYINTSTSYSSRYAKYLNLVATYCTSFSDAMALYNSYNEVIQLSSPTLSQNNDILNWTSISNASSYQLYRRDSDGYTLIYSGSNTSYDITSSMVGNAYLVIAIGDGTTYSNSDYSNQLTISSIQLNAPILSLSGNRLTINVNDTNATSFTLSWGLGTNYSAWKSYDVTSQSITIQLSNIANYRAINQSTDDSYSSSAYSNIVYFDGSSATQLGAPTLNYNSSSNTLYWSAVENASGYYVYLENDSHEYYQIATLSSSTLTYSPNQTGRYKIQAIGSNSYGNSNMSNYVSVNLDINTTPTEPTTPTTPTEPTTSNIFDWLKYFIELIDYYFQTILNGIVNLFSGIATAISTLFEYVKNFTTTFGSLLSFLPTEISSVLISIITISMLFAFIKFFKG